MRQAFPFHPAGIAVGADGSLYVAGSRHCIRKVDPAGTITTVVGSGARRLGSYSGDGGPATQASLNWPGGVALGADSSLYIADTRNHRIRKVDPAGIITTVAGSAERRYSGDGGPATQATLDWPQGVALDADGSLYIADRCNSRIRKVDPAGIITTVVGNGTAGYSGDRGPAIQASLWSPAAVALGANGSLYIADTLNYRIRRVRWLPCELDAAKAAADGLRAEAVNPYLLRGERDQAIATLNDLRLRTEDPEVLAWLDESLKAMTGGE
jgi:serine/threonine-protein kinase